MAADKDAKAAKNGRGRKREGGQERHEDVKAAKDGRDWDTKERNEKDNNDRDTDWDAAVGRSGDVCLGADALSVGESGEGRIELDLVSDLVD